MKSRYLLITIALGMGLILVSIAVLAASGRVFDVANGEAHLTIRGESASDLIGYDLVSADINGDGYDDIILSAHGMDNGTITDTGAAYLVYGQPSLSGTLEISTTTGVTFLGAGVKDYTGQILASGNFNGDQYDDLLIASRWADVISGSQVIMDAGKVYLVLGQPVFSPIVSLDTEADVTFLGSEAHDFTGQGLASGNLNNDAYDDFIIGSYRWNNYQGKVYVLRGPPPLSATVDINATADLILLGASAGDALGYSPASGDVNGDGYDDLILGAFSADPEGRDLAGVVYVLFDALNLSGTHVISDVADLTLLGMGERFRTGWSLASGDVNGDNYDDIIIAAPFADLSESAAGAIHVIFGQPNLSGTLEISTTASITILGGDAGDNLGRWGLASSDVNADGYDDIIAGALYADPSPSRMNAGKAYVVFGKSTFSATIPISTTAAVTILGAESGDWVGYSVGGGDLNGDGYQEILVGASGADPAVGRENAGKVYAFDTMKFPHKLYLPLVLVQP